MPFLFQKLVLLCLILPLLPGLSPSAAAQQVRGTSMTPRAPSLRQLTQNSGYIFVGTVSAVEHLAATGPNEVATMRISFRVEQAIRGVSTGQTLMIREWAGLWESGERYHLGERVLLFLYRPSKLGLTSPVGGPLGRFTMGSHGEAVLEQERIAALSSDSVLEAQRRRKNRVSSRDFVRAIRRAAEE